MTAICPPSAHTGDRSNQIAICYDYDGTLSPGNLQENKFLPDIGLTPQEFWREVNAMSDTKAIDPTIAYMYAMLTRAKSAGVSVTRESLASWGNAQTHFPGLDGWFERHRRAAARHGMDLRHYVISSGNAEIIEGSAIAPHLDGVFASRFLYDASENAVWPALALNYTNKTQILYRVNKGALSPANRHKINDYIPDSLRPVPFTHIIYIGDGETDIPCFRLTSSLGGYAIAVYDDDPQDARRYLAQGRVNAAAPADYRKSGRLDALIAARVALIAAERELALAESGSQLLPYPPRRD